MQLNPAVEIIQYNDLQEMIKKEPIRRHPFKMDANKKIDLASLKSGFLASNSTGLYINHCFLGVFITEWAAKGYFIDHFYAKAIMGTKQYINHSLFSYIAETLAGMLRQLVLLNIMVYNTVYGYFKYNILIIWFFLNQT